MKDLEFHPGIKTYNCDFKSIITEEIIPISFNWVLINNVSVLFYYTLFGDYEWDAVEKMIKEVIPYTNKIESYKAEDFHSFIERITIYKK